LATTPCSCTTARVGRANIDHLIVPSSGVWVVDAKNYAGRVE
jgi:hypothetical protein